MSTYQPSGQAGAGPTRPTTPQTSVMAVLSLIFAFVFPLLGLVLGIVALSQTGRYPSRYGGRGLAVAGTVVAALMLLVWVGVGAVVVTAAREIARLGPGGPGMYGQTGAKYQCLSNVKNLAIAGQMWAVDHGNTLPTADRWVDDLQPYVGRPEVFKCPGDTSGARSSFGMNAALSGAPLASIADPQRTVLFYETTRPGDNPSGGPEDVAVRHDGESNYGFVDGHAASTILDRVSFSR